MGVTCIAALNKIKYLENRVARIFTNSDYVASAFPLIRKLDWPTIKELIESETFNIVYNSVYDEALTYCMEMLVWLSDSCKREFHNAQTHLAVPLCILVSE